MGCFYFDESRHTKANFILGAFAYSEIALEGDVAEALRQSRLEPGVEEFKSGATSVSNARNPTVFMRASCPLAPSDTALRLPGR